MFPNQYFAYAPTDSIFPWITRGKLVSIGFLVSVGLATLLYCSDSCGDTLEQSISVSIDLVLSSISQQSGGPESYFPYF